LEKVFGKIALPTASCIDEREIKERYAISYFFSFIQTHIFVRGEKKQLHP
jgi:hypothetical protein